ncbi:MAG: hypothetical protein N6V49_00155 [Serratia symbiotica]|nr:hypothetical protein [Serratia symbiotica]
MASNLRTGSMTATHEADLCHTIHFLVPTDRQYLPIFTDNHLL